MSLQFRRGTETDRLSIVPLEGEPIWQMNDNTLWVGDGSTAGGIAVAGDQNINTTSNVTFNSALISTTATVATLKFGDGTTMTTAPINEANQSLNTNSNVTFNSVSISTTATVGTLKFSNDAYIQKGNNFDDVVIVSNTASVKVNAAQGLIVGDGGGTSQLDVNQITGLIGGAVNIAAVLQVGDNSGTGYVTSRGGYDLRLTTNDNTGTGAQVLLHDGQDGIFNVYSGAYSVMAANTLTNTLNSDQFNFQNGVGSNIAQLSTNGSTHYGNYHNFGNTDATAQINSQGTGNLVLCASSDNNNSGYVLLSSGESGDVELYGPGTRQIAVFSTGTVTINTRSGANTFTSTFGSTGTLTVPQLAATNTSTVGLLTVGKNNSQRTIPGQTDYANAMLIANNNTSGPIIFSPRGASTNRSLMITRNADLAFHNGAQIQSTSVGGLSMSCAASSSTAAITLTSGGSTGIVSVGPTGVLLRANNPITFDAYDITLTTSTGVTTLPGLLTLAVYTKAALGAITGSVGQIAIVSDSAGGSNPNGMMAFWDTTNARWSYVHDNNAL